MADGTMTCTGQQAWPKPPDGKMFEWRPCINQPLPGTDRCRRHPHVTTYRWQGQILVDADLHKVPGDPAEAAKHALDQIRDLEAPIIEITREEIVDDKPTGRVDRWLVDTDSGQIEEVPDGS